MQSKTHLFSLLSKFNKIKVLYTRYHEWFVSYRTYDILTRVFITTYRVTTQSSVFNYTLDFDKIEYVARFSFSAV